MKSTNLRWLSQNLDALRIPLNATQRAKRQGNIPYWGANGIIDYVDEVLIDERVILIGEDGAPFFERDKDLAFVSDGPIWPNNHIHILRPNARLIDDRFLCYFLKQVEYAYHINGSTRDKLTQAQLGSIVISYPEIEIQKIVADFLDRKTARIDQLIEKKKRLVEVLEEKRAATITSAVYGNHPTEGAGSRDRRVVGEDVSMTNLQRAPLLPLKRLAVIRSSNVDKVVENDEIPVRLCNYIDVYYNDQIHTDLEFTVGSVKHSEFDRFGLKHGDIVITKDSETPDDIAVQALVVCSADDLVCGYHLALLRSNPSILNGAFLFYALKSSLIQATFSIRAKGITRFGLTLGDIGSVAIPVPDLSIQKAIADFLDRETTRINQLIEKINESIDRLLEFRSALITAVVTGQIDVATWRKQGTTDRRINQIEEVRSA